MSINSVMVSRVQMQYTAEYIANVFWNQNIAQVRNITLIPYFHGNTFYQTAYISIANWCDSEIAYNFIQRLKDKNKKTRIVYHLDNWWSCKLDHYHYGKTFYNTTNFTERYFKTDAVEEAPKEENPKKEEPKEEVLLAPELEEGEVEEGIQADEECLIEMLMKFLEEAEADEEDKLFKKECQMFEKMYPNVTLRPHQQSFAI